MRHTLLRVLLGTSVVGLTLMMGCNRGQRPCHCQNKPCCGCDGPVVMAPDDSSRMAAVANVPANGTPGSLPPFTCAKATPLADPPSSSPAPLGSVQSGPWTRADGKSGSVGDSGIQQVSHVVPQSGKEELAPRRTFNDITANPCFGHAPDYSWLTGELQYLHVRDVWKVRYASAEEEDPYGGSVTLIDAGPMSEFKSGQMVRVEGQLVNPEAHVSGAPYRVRSIKPLP